MKSREGVRRMVRDEGERLTIGIFEDKVVHICTVVFAV